MPEGIKKIGLQIDFVLQGAPAAVKGFEGISKAVQASSKSFVRAGKETKKLGAELKKVGSGVRAVASSAQAGVKANQNLANTTKSAADAAVRLSSQIKSFGSSLGKVRSGLSQSVRATRDFTKRKRELAAATSKANRTSKDYGKTLVKITKDEVVRGQSVRRFIVIYLQTALSIEAIKSATVALAREFGELIQGTRDLAKSLRSIGEATGSSEEELSIMRDIIEAVALASPKSAGEIAIMAEEFNRAGFSARETAKSLILVNSASAATGRSMDDLKGAVLEAFAGDVEKASKTLLVNMEGITDEQIEQGEILDILAERYGLQVQNALELEGSWATVKSVLGDAGLVLAEQLNASDEMAVVVKETGLVFAAWISDLISSGKAVNFIKTTLDVIYKAFQILRGAFLVFQVGFEGFVDKLLLIPNIFIHGFSKAFEILDQDLKNSPALKALLEINLGQSFSDLRAGADKSFEEALEKANLNLEKSLNALGNKNTRTLKESQEKTTTAIKDNTEKFSGKIDELLDATVQGFFDLERALELSAKGTGIEAGFQNISAAQSRRDLAESLQLTFPKSFEGNQEKILDAISDAVLELSEKISPTLEELEFLDLRIIENFKDSARLDDQLLSETQRLREESAERLVELRDESKLQGDALGEAIEEEKKSLAEQIKQAKQQVALAKLDLRQQRGLLELNRKDIVKNLTDARDQQQRQLDKNLEQQKKEEAARKERAKEAIKEANERLKRQLEAEDKRQAEIVKRLQDILGAVISSTSALISTIAAGASNVQDPKALANEMTKAFEATLPDLDSAIDKANKDLIDAQNSRDDAALKESTARLQEIKETLERQGIGETEAKQLLALGEMKDLLREGRDFGKQSTASFQEMQDQLLKNTEAFENLTGTSFGPEIEQELIDQAEQSKQQARELLDRLPDIGRDFAERLAASQRARSEAQDRFADAKKAGDVVAGQAAREDIKAAELETFDIQQEQAAFQSQVAQVLGTLQQSGSALSSAVTAVAERDPEGGGISDAAIGLVQEFQKLNETIAEQSQRGDPEAEASAQEALTEAMNARTEAEETFTKDLESSIGEITESNLELGRESAKKTLIDFSGTIGEVFKPELEATLQPVVSSALEVFGLSTKNVGAITSTLTGGALAFAGPLIELFSQAPEQIEKFIDVFIDGAVDLITRIIENLPRIAAALIIGIVGAIPKLITALVKALPTLIEELAKHLPKISEDLINLLVEEGPKIIDELVRNTPRMINAMIRLFVAQFENIGNVIDRLFDPSSSVDRAIKTRRTIPEDDPNERIIFPDGTIGTVAEFERLQARQASGSDSPPPRQRLAPAPPVVTDLDKLAEDINTEALESLSGDIKDQQIQTKRLIKELGFNTQELNFENNSKDTDPAIKILLDLLQAQEDANDLLREQNRNFATASGAFNPYADPTTASGPPSVPQEVIINIGQERLANILLDLDQSGYRGVAI